MAEWIWLPKAAYSDKQNGKASVFCEGVDNFVTAYFVKKLDFGLKPERVRLKVGADTRYVMFVNDGFVGVGPVSPGGDHLRIDPMPVNYLSEYVLTPKSSGIKIYVRVRLSPAVETEWSSGQGGLYIDGEAEFGDGSSVRFGTDESWLTGLDPRFISPTECDFTLRPDPSVSAEVGEDRRAELSPIPLLSERFITPINPEALVAEPGTVTEKVFEFDRIYSAYPVFSLSCNGECLISLTPFELEGQDQPRELIRADSSLDYRAELMRSCGGFKLKVENRSEKPLTVSNIGIIFTCYPAKSESSFECSDSELNSVIRLCENTLQICCQHLHLDSPRHQETLACTGDYFIESLMGYFTTGDTALTRFDLVRTADLLEDQKGFMFHTSYSLIWVFMLWDYYMFTGDNEIFTRCSAGLDALMKRMDSYIGDSGLIETPPSWMFIDWIDIDGYSLHHPPKALGQTVMNSLYYKALNIAGKIYSLTGREDLAAVLKESACRVKEAVNDLLYDAGAGLYLDGLNTPQSADRGYHPDVSGYMPCNTDKKYHTTQANTLAVYCGICEGERAREITERIAVDPPTDYQPYFAHFILDSLRMTGLFKNYGMKLLDRWKPLARITDKGLQEGWSSTDFTGFDHSHAWGGTPLYQLPVALSGFKMLEPGFKRIALHPDPCGLEWAKFSIPSPYGNIEFELRGESFRLSIPDEIDAEYY